MINVSTYFKKMSVFLLTPAGKISAILAMAASYFAPIWAILLVIFVFIAVDFITGIFAAKKRKEPIVSCTMKNTVVKLIAYYVTIILAYLIQKELVTFYWFQITKFSAAFICITEFKSITENLSFITGNKIFISIFEKINSLFKKKEEEVFNKPEETK